MINPIVWQSDELQLLDQTLLPTIKKYVSINTVKDVFTAIKTLKVRGAPAIGITAAYGLFIAQKKSNAQTASQFLKELDAHIAYLSEARPTAVNLFWAMKKIREAVTKNLDSSVEILKLTLRETAIAIHNDDRERCDAIGKFGAELIPQNARILTHCNTGALATGGIGTALGVIYTAHNLGKNIHVYANETRPVLQGARLTAFELDEANIPSQLITDSMGAFLMQQKKVDVVIVGADRVSADGSAANKIGTYMLAVLAKHHNIPFYVAAPLSTFDMNIENGNDIPIEQRDYDEIRNVFGKCQIAPKEMACWNPAFDITPPSLITGIITEKGVLKAPYKAAINKQISNESLDFA